MLRHGGPCEDRGLRDLVERAGVRGAEGVRLQQGMDSTEWRQFWPITSGVVVLGHRGPPGLLSQRPKNQ